MYKIEPPTRYISLKAKYSGEEQKSPIRHSIIGKNYMTDLRRDSPKSAYRSNIPKYTPQRYKSNSKNSIDLSTERRESMTLHQRNQSMQVVN